MRVALVCPYDWSSHGGVRAHVAALGAALQEDHDVRIIAPASRPLGASGVDALVRPVGRAVGIPFNDSVARVALSPAAARRTVRALRAWRPDVVHVHEPLVPSVALAAAARSPSPVVGTFHAWSDREAAYRAIAPLGRRVVRGLDARLAVSPVAERYAARTLGLDADELTVIPNGVSADRLGRALPRPELLDPSEPLIVFVGRLEARKGAEVLLRAFRLLHRTHPHARLLVVGDGPERRRAERLVGDLPGGRARFAGAVDDEEKARLLASADLFAAPNLGGESFGIVLLEAMAAGLPVVASDIPGFRAVCRHQHEGVLVPAGHAAALAEAMGALLDDPAARKRLGTAGRERAAEYSWPRIAERVVAVYREAGAG
ncbi:glycosyltransferase family 1 protein [Egibacter rhizosphaerae]|uniref:Glycosyltransferase family 1 protein n=1 Tax=Egibacter rhizosphaerae TaxID=1670831 RepID=A0A411YJS8_9ACTN|nr:glycosyltransferase family 4 protein [Egibacter rhizosphaerae]QBI21459.1 glycosyltransferase family 1 protein [Egibacter rhizosphaerae]